jgi:hypothetical protein|tara:strand:- start:1030 stop:1236 length:207 start_codon:yes stop_codon:yes gene_type:complete
MPKYTKIGSGNAFKNSDTEGNKPHYSGNKFELEFGGETHELQLAIWNSTAKNGNDYLRVVLTKVEKED